MDGFLYQLHYNLNVDSSIFQIIFLQWLLAILNETRLMKKMYLAYLTTWKLTMTQTYRMK